MVSRQGRILIVDDEEAVRKLLRQKLSREGYQCEEASTAEQALGKLKSKPVEVAILDIKMPGKSGIELLPEIKDGYPDTAVIMATAVTQTSVVIQCMKQGAADYIAKPFNLDEVVQSVERVLEKRKLELELRQYQQHLEKTVEKQAVKIRKLFLGAIESLVYALEAKDKYTAGHSRRVTDFAVVIGCELGLSATGLEDLYWAALLHDVGKIAVDQLIQNKPSRLTPEEYEHMMAHAHVGADIVKQVVSGKVVEIIEHHHDYYDGSGLAQVITGEDIPLGARILAVADTFDAMTSDRPYRPAMSPEEARDEIKRCTGIQFDPVVTAAFLRIPVGELVLAKARSLVDYTAGNSLVKQAQGRV